MQRLCNTHELVICKNSNLRKISNNEKSTNYDVHVHKQPVMQQLVWIWASPHYSAATCANSSCMRVMGDIVRVSVSVRM